MIDETKNPKFDTFKLQIDHNFFKEKNNNHQPYRQL